jgi:lambda family phage tail tape measure protein
VTTGKLSFADFTKSILTDIARIAVRQAETQAISGLAGLLGIGSSTQNAGSAAAAAGYGTTSYAGAYGFSDGGYTGDGGKYEPKGVVHGGEVVIRKEVVQQPGMRPYLENLNNSGAGYADGGYVGLSSGSSSTPASSAGQGSVVIQQNISVPESSNNSSQADISAVSQAYADTAKRGAEQAIAQELRTGGSIWRAVNGR